MEGFSPTLRFFMQLTDVKTAVWLQFIYIVILAVVVYKLGYAKKLPLLKNVVIYTCLVIGCLVLLILSYALPVAEALAVSALILIIYKIRLYQSKKQQSEAK
ncbi:YlaH-like family protein [Neobacillus citreus]|uniref:YlaH-like family protein n=1 Tax=Neobacillus citreus TaxID=2833578 RepID=A0A942SW69_9BACI|nr:YlaH-like family protein [Neobacillus citreus]MCH6265742.1 YlaH-like family protein [Neobacillus citreus]